MGRPKGSKNKFYKIYPIKCLCGCGNFPSKKRSKFLPGHNSFIKNPFLGKKHSETSKIIMSEKKKGKHLSIKTEFKKGQTPYNKNVPSLYKKSNPAYSSIHKWASRWINKPKKCEQCGKETGVIDLSNISHEYKREIFDWRYLCHMCHMRYDRKNGWGKAILKFPIMRGK